MMNRDFYIPKGARKITPKSGGAVFYIHERDGVPCGLAFVGRAQKPTWNFRFRSVAEREKRIADTIHSVEAHARYKAERKAAQNKPHGWEKGLILSGTWGYEQTNVDFFVVTKVIGKSMVEIAQIGSAEAAGTEPYTWGQRYVMPDPDAISGKRHRVKVNMAYGTGSCKSPVYGSLSPWDGRHINETSYH